MALQTYLAKITSAIRFWKTFVFYLSQQQCLASKTKKKIYEMTVQKRFADHRTGKLFRPHIMYNNVEHACKKYWTVQSPTGSRRPQSPEGVREEGGSTNFYLTAE